MKIFSRLFVFSLTVASALAGPADDERVIAEPLRKIAFGSCMKEGRKAPIFKAVAADAPDAFIWLGDNIYGDSEDVKVLREKYGKLASHADYAPVKRKTKHILGVWDDHDYGANDAGKEFVSREGAQQAFLDFFGVAADDDRRGREGVYSSTDIGPEGKRVRVILLDARYHRDPIGSDGEVLGESQWEWLKKQLTEEPADLNIIGCGIQMLPSEHRFEKWANFPAERRRLMKLLATEGLAPTVLISGDRHMAEVSREELKNGKVIYDVTSSSLNLAFGGRNPEVNIRRVGPIMRVENYGLLEIDWSGDSPKVKATIKGLGGSVLYEHDVVG